MPDDNVITLPLPTNGANGSAPAKRRFPVRPKTHLRIDAGAVVESVVARAQELDQDTNRGKWLEDRLARYAKYRGWLTDKSWPWSGCSNVHIPMLQIAELRANAGLHNVVMTLRPLLSAKASSKGGLDREEKITQLIDYQLFLEPGPEIAERRITDFIAGGLQDGNGVAYTPWVRDERRVTETIFAPAIPETTAPSDYLDAEFRKLFPGATAIEMHETKDHVFFVSYTQRQEEHEAVVTVFEDAEDGSLEFQVERDVMVYDGPVGLPLPIERVLVPTRCTNLQPPTEANPTGAPYVFLRWPYRLDDIRRLKKSGTFNFLDDAGLAKIEAAARGRGGLVAPTPDRPAEELQEQKDAIEGREHREGDAENDATLGHLTVPLLVCFDRWDVDGDGLAEDAFWVIDPAANVLCEARRLTDRWPASTPYRPLAEWCPIPVKDRWYGISMLELGEPLYDLVKGTFDQMFDGWTIATLPFFFYGASSKLNTDVIQIAPGQGYPVPGNPRETLMFPNMPQRDLSGGLGIIGLAMQFVQQLFAQGPLQQGQVPTGKASALRTFGTTQALLQQGDVRADQMLIRLFQGLAQLALNFHRMNRRLLPPGKEIRVVGWDGPSALGYKTIEKVDEIDAEIGFEFKPEFLNSNPAVLRESLQLLLGVVIQPLTFQLGAANAETVSRLLRDFVRALRLDPKRYLTEPPPDALPPLMAEEVVQMFMQGQEPVGRPMEGAEAHMAKLAQWQGSDAFGMLPREHAPLVQGWLRQVSERMKQERMAAAAAQFQQAMAQQNGPASGVPTSVAEPGMGGDAAASADALTAEATGA